MMDYETPRSVAKGTEQKIEWNVDIKTKAGVNITIAREFGVVISFDKPVRALGLTDKEAVQIISVFLKFVPSYELFKTINKGRQK